MSSTTSATHAEIASSIAFLDELFAVAALSDISFRLWDDTVWPDDDPRAVTIVLKHPGALREMFIGGTEKKLIEAYLRDDFDISGDLEVACRLADLFSRRRSGDWLRDLTTFYRLQRLPVRPADLETFQSFSRAELPVHSPERDRQAISFHYDLSNDFFRLWLDARMLYSCAYFQTANASLDAAQTAKLHLLCRKLRLRPRQRVLDIGCGWGGFALFAARHYCARVTGITISPQQAELARRRVDQAALSNDVKILECDYRELNETAAYDAIVSVGMSEHVGRECLPAYFRTVNRLLVPGGVFLNHAIGEGIHPRPRRDATFMDEYIFPDTDIPPLPAVLQAAESAGFEVRDVENLREHYTLTLRHWRRQLEAGHLSVLNFVNEATYRAWRLYLAGSAYGFDHVQLAVYQTLFSKPDQAGKSHLPLTRVDWYAPLQEAPDAS
jgi:cyclopropane-fatty-acyl-phospholipid synthase